MIKKFKKTLVLFLFFSTYQLVYSQAPDLNISLDNSNLNGQCAPLELIIPIDVWPETNPSTTEYIFILHDVNLPYTLVDTIRFFHDDDNPPSNINFGIIENSSCNASGLEYVVDVYVKDLTFPPPFNFPLGFPNGGTEDFTLNGKPDASFNYEENDCGIFTFTNTSTSGEFVNNSSCTAISNDNVEWQILVDGVDASLGVDYNILNGALDPGSSSLNVEFEPGIYDIVITAGDTLICSDSDTVTICVEEYDFDIDDLNIIIPDEVCVNELISIVSDIDEIDFSCSSNENWFVWSVSQVELNCIFDDQLVLDGQAIFPNLVGSNPTFSIPNPGTYEISFTSIDPCIDPPINNTHVISVVGYPVIDQTSIDYNQNCDLSADLSLDFDSCNSEPPYLSTWTIVSGDSGEFEGSLNVNENKVVVENTGDYTIEYTISSINESCGVDTAYFDITISDTLSLSIGNDTTICEGENLTIIPTISAGEPDFDYLWEYNGETSTNPQLDILNIESEIEVILEVTDSDDPNCTASDTLLITISPTPSYTLDSSYIKCEGIPIDISFEEEIQLGDIVLWDENIVSEVLTYAIDQDSLINVSVTSPFGCVLDDSTQVNIFLNQDFENLPDTISYCFIGEITLEDTITHPTISTNGFWSGDNVLFNGNQGNNTFFTDSFGTFMVYYTKQSEFGCLVTDSVVVEVSSNPSTAFTLNNEGICTPGESYIVLSESTLDNPPNTSYTLSLIAGQNGIETEISFEQSEIQSDTIFFNLNLSSCNFNYDDNQEVNSSVDGAYYIKLTAQTVCDKVTSWNKIYTSSVPEADFTFDEPDDCHIDVEYQFINTSIGENNFFGICSSPNINWQLSGNEGIDWVIDSLTLESDIFKVVFLSTGSYDVTLISSNSCAADTIIKNVTIEESPLADIGVEVNNENLCSPDDAILFLTDDTYLNPDTTSYLISIYAGEDNLIGTYNFNQSSLPDQSEGVLLDEINTSSCDFIYDDASYNGTYKIQVEAFNICDSASSVFSKFYYAEPATPQFSIDNSNECTSRWYTFTNDSDLSQNNFNNCSTESFIFWELSGIEDVDWELDPSSELGSSTTSGSDIISVKFLTSDVFSISMISSSCSNDTISESICVNTNLDFIEDEELILFDDTTCLNTSYIVENNISDTQACGMEFLWSIVSNDITCNQNQSLDFNLTSESNPIPDITFFNPGIYQVSCTISNSCEDTLVISKTVNVLKSPELSSFEVNYLNVCDSNHISINLAIDSCVSALYNPIWGVDNDDQLDSLNDNFIEIIFSDYENNEVQYTVGNYCATFDTVYVHNFVPIINSFGPDIDFCVQPDYTLELTNDSLNGSWSLNNELLPLDSLGIYFFTPDQIGSFLLIYSYTDFNGCEVSESLNINVQDTPQFEVIVSNQECAFDQVPFNISLSGSSFDLVPGENFFWEDSQVYATTIIPSPNEHPIAGVISANEIGEFTSYFYYYDSLENETCYASDSMIFIANGADFSIVADSILCDGDTTSLGLQITSVSSNGPWSLSWEPSGQTFQPIDVYPNTTTTYVASITDANNCVSTDTLVLDVLCSNETLVDFEPFIVENETQSLFPNVPFYNNVLYEGCTNAKITFFKPDCIDISEEINIQYKVKINGVNQPSNLVNNNSRFFLSPSFDSSLPIVIPSDSSSITLDIFTTNDYTSDSPDTILFAINPITYSDCFSSDTSVVDVEFIIFDQPDFNIDVTDSFTTYCPGDDAVIEVFPNGGVGAEMIAQGSNSAFAPYTYEWQWPYVGTTAIQTHNPLDTTTYYVQVTDACGYIDTASVEVFVTQYDPLIANADRTYVCEDTLAQICVNAEGGEGNYTYSWSNESSTQCIEVFHQLDPYTVTVTDGCDNQVLANGFVDDGMPENPYFEYLPIPHIEFGIEFYNYTPSLFGHTYLWSFDDSFGSDNYHPIHVYPDEGSYNVTLTVSDSLYQDCKKEFSSYVNVESYFKLWVPNSFTPNNDGVNDLFKPVVIGVDYYELIITNRWGEIVFTSSDINESWDGYLDGKIAPSGVYTCEVVYSKLNDIMKLSHFVNINLIR